MIELTAKNYVSDRFSPYYQSDERFRFEISTQHATRQSQLQILYGNNLT